MPTISRRTLLAGAGATAAGGLLAACGRRDKPAAAGDPTPVRVLTGLGFQGREAYLDVAIETGWFTEAGLQVEVLPGNGTKDNLTLLSEGRAEFATLDVSGALIEHGRGTYTDWALTSILHEQNLSCVMVLASSPITSLQDLEGRSVAVIPGGVNTVVFPLLGELAGFDASRVIQVPLEPPAPHTFGAALAGGQVEAVMQFVVGQDAIENAAGAPVRVFPYSEWITDMYGSGIGVSRRLAAQDPGLVRRFNAAALRALEYAIANPREAAEVFVARHQEQSAEVAEGELRALQPYVTQAGGRISVVRLAQNIAVLEAMGALPGGYSPDDVAQFGLDR
jgi:NitT/TauT family transport system substrate-binding protein